MTLRLPSLALLSVMLTSVTAQAQDAKALRAQADIEPNQEKLVSLLCRAADLEPKNKDFRHDCEERKAALISADKQSLKTAQDAADAGQVPKAKRYAKYVSIFDPDTRHQAEQLLARLNASDAPSPGSSSPNPSGAPDASGTLLAQATTAFESGNLSAARSAAERVTDPALKPAAARVVNEVDRYASLVASGRSHEQAREFAPAERSFQSALDLNSHVAADDLAARVQRMHQLASATPPPTPGTGPAPVVVVSRVPPKPTVTESRLPKPEISPDEKKKRLLEESAQALSRNDLDTAGREFKQVLDLDPGNAEAKRGLAGITVALNKDPERLEKTLREAVTAFYASNFEDAESRLNRYLGADGAKKKGAAFFYLGATETTLAILDTASRRAAREHEAQENFKQARSAGYQPVEKYVSGRILQVWKNSGS